MVSLHRLSVLIDKLLACNSSSGIFLENRFRGQIEIFKYREGTELYHLNADYSLRATLRTTQGGQRHLQGGQNAPFAPSRKIPGLENDVTVSAHPSSSINILCSVALWYLMCIQCIGYTSMLYICKLPLNISKKYCSSQKECPTVSTNWIPIYVQIVWLFYNGYFHNRN